MTVQLQVEPRREPCHISRSSETHAPRALRAVAGFSLVTADLPRLVRFCRDVLGFSAHGDDKPIDEAEMTLLGLSGLGRRQVLSLGG